MEIKSLTGIRGLAALYVVAFHLADKNAIPQILPLIKNGYIAVDFFFVLSGFIMSLVYYSSLRETTQENYINFAYNRLARVYPVYLLILIVSFIFDFILNGVIPTHATVFINTFFLQSVCAHNYIGSSWSLSTEIIAYLLFPLLLAIIRDKRAIIASVMIAIGTLTYLFASRTPNSLDYSYLYSSIARCLADYVIGIAAYVSFKNGLMFNRNSSYVLVALLLISLNYAETDLYSLALFSAIIPTLIDSKNIVSKTLSLKPLHYLGNISYSLYLVHSVLITQFRGQMQFFEHWRTVSFILSLIISTILFHLVEKPARNWLKSIRTTRTQYSATELSIN
ncbi:acyltransferase family protein [Kluyvera sp. NPDC087067]|uniref:acyltransferase family protein n=1 Tax=Kluyvera sp. NPDC087067 TaxID=3364105 RepID=UPI0037FA2756